MAQLVVHLTSKPKTAGGAEFESYTRQHNIFQKHFFWQFFICVQLTSHYHGIIFEFTRDLSHLKMPKFKRSTAAHCACQAKKRKRSQREDPVWRQEEQERNTAARQQLCVDNLETREQEQHRDTEAYRQIRLENLPRRLEEQLRDTAAHRRVREEDPERRREAQLRDTAAHRRVREEDPDRRCEEQPRDTAAHRRAREEDPERRRDEQERNTIGNGNLYTLV